MTVWLLTEHHMEFLSLNGSCAGSNESTLVKMQHCWKSHVTAQLLFSLRNIRNMFSVYAQPYVPRINADSRLVEND